MSHYDQVEELKRARNVKYNIDPAFTRRWSPRGYTGEKISEEDFLAIVEAGRLSPSCANSQPWRVIYGYRETDDWDMLFDLLVQANQSWVKNCGVLMIFVAKKIDDKGKEWGKHMFDTGAFWCSMALEASNRNLPMHGMGGFDHDRAREVLRLSDDYEVAAMAAMGVPGNPEALSEKQQEMEKPNGRKESSELIIKAKQASALLA